MDYMESLPKPIGSRVIHLFSRIVACEYSSKRKSMQELWNLIKRGNRCLTTIGKVIVFMDCGFLYVIRELNKEKVRISLGETVVWGNWKIECKQEVKALALQQLFIRTYRGCNSKIPFRLNPAKRNIHPLVLQSLPIIVNQHNKLVFFPHLEKSSDLQPFTVSFHSLFHYKQIGYIVW